MIGVRRSGDGVGLFLLKFTKKMVPHLDLRNAATAGRLTKQAIANLDTNRLRRAEKDERTHARLTGAFEGRNGRPRAIQGEAIRKGFAAGGGKRQGKGVGWPKKDVLDRRARHWRALEFGTPYVTMPRGLFLQGGSPQYPSHRTRGDVFHTYREYIRGRGLRRGYRSRLTGRQATARQKAVASTVGGGRRRSFLVGADKRGRGIEAKHFLEDAWDEVVGPGGEKAYAEYVKIIDIDLGEFQR